MLRPMKKRNFRRERWFSKNGEETEIPIVYVNQVGAQDELILTEALFNEL